MTIALITLAIILLILGIVGTVYPVIPSLPFMFIGAWLLAYSGDYQIIGSASLVVLGLVAIFGFAMDFVAGLLGAKYTGADKQALWGAFLGGMVGAFLGIIGLILGPLIGATIGEFMAKRDVLRAGKVGIGTFIGFILGVVAKIGSALTMIAILLWQYGVYWFSAT